MAARVNVLYFAALRDAAGISAETVATEAVVLRDVYAELQARHALPFAAHQLRVAMDGEFVSWEDMPREGSEIAFIPPVSGG